jgi:hypothetical protein
MGLRPEQCVHEVDSGSHIKEVEGGVEVHHRNGSMRFLPALEECIQDIAQRMEARSKMGLQGGLPRLGADGWLDNAAYTPTKNVQEFTADYTVPQNPPSDTGQVLFYFIGSENFQTTVKVSILQPVLTWGNGLKGWSIASWNCCPAGQTQHSNSLQGFAAGDVLHGVIDKSAADKWTVISTVKGQNATLTVDAIDRTFDWTDVTLETYRITQCNQFAEGPMRFSNMRLVVDGGAVESPKWKPNNGTQCAGKMTIINPQTATIQHN